MDLEQFKEALGDEKFSELEQHISDLQGQRDQARNESISGRKGMKEKISTLESQTEALLEKLGVDSFDEIDELPDAKGAAEAAKQYETKLKRLEKQLADAEKAREDISGRYLNTQKQIKLSEALGGHEWLARDVVESFISPRLAWDGDELLYKEESGNLVSVSDAVSGLAKSRPELLKSTGAGGAGFSSRGARGSQGTKTMTRAEFEALPPSEKVELSKSGVELH